MPTVVLVSGSSSLRTRGFSLVVAVLATLVGTLMAASARETDLRTQSDGRGATEISFCSRPSPDAFGFPGHAFVGFSEEPRDQARAFRAVSHTVAASAGLAPIEFTYFGGASVARRPGEERYTHMSRLALRFRWTEPFIRGRPI